MKVKPKYAFFWDVGNVLIKFRESQFRNILKDNKSEALSTNFFLVKYKKILDDSFSGKISVGKTWRQLSGLTGCNEREFQAIKNKYKISLNVNLIKFIKEKLGRYDLGIISDLHQIAFRHADNYDGEFFKIFNPNLVFLSNYTGLSKNVNGYSYLKQIFDSTKKEKKLIIYIDDERKNIVLAKSLGVNAILFPKTGKKDLWRQANKKVIKSILTIVHKKYDVNK